MFSSLAISSGFIPNARSSMIRFFFLRALGGRPHSAFFFREVAIPDLTLWTMFSLSNCAKTARMPAIIRPIGVVKSRLSQMDTKETFQAISSLIVSSISVVSRPQRLSFQTSTTSILPFLANSIISARIGRKDRLPLCLSSISFTICHPRLSQYFRAASSCIGIDCWSLVLTLAKTATRIVSKTLSFFAVFGIGNKPLVDAAFLSQYLQIMIHPVYGYNQPTASRTPRIAFA